MCLIFLQYLFTSQNFIDLRYYFGFIVPIENIIYSLKFIINNQEFTFILARVSAFVKNSYVSFYQIEFLKTQKTHIKP